MTASPEAIRLGLEMGVRLVVRSAWTESVGLDPVAYEFDQGRIVLGRGAGADVQLPHPAVSATHASMRVENTGYVLVDEGSTNGTRVNGTRLVPGRAKALRSGDVVEMGGFAIEIQCSVPVSLPTSADRTAALARHLVRQALAGPGAVGPMAVTVTEGPDAGTRVELSPPPSALVVGRGEEAELRLTDADCSRAHLTLERDLEGVLLRDLESKNGVRVGGKRVHERRLRDGDTIAVGETVLCFEDPAAGALRALRDQPDVAMETPSLPSMGSLPATEPVPRSSEETPSIAPETGPPPSAPPSPRPARPARPATDMIIYMLAGAVLALSATGLWLLLRAG